FVGGYLNDAASLINMVNTVTPIYDMDAGDDATVLTATANGSGSGDLSVLIPSNLFGSDGSKNVYLYSTFGNTQLPSTSTFAEWAGVVGPNDTPPPPSVPDAGTTMMLLGMACVGVEGLRRKLQG